MAHNPITQPVKDTVPKIDNDIAVGEDLAFQRRWWKFEFAIWVFFTIIVILDLFGFFGRGPVAKARFHTVDGSMDIHYERIERFSTPSILAVSFGQNAIHDGKVQLWVSETLVRELGNQRVVPQPEMSVLSRSGILYTFLASQVPVTVEFALSPSSVGMNDLRLVVPGFADAKLKVFVMP